MLIAHVWQAPFPLPLPLATPHAAPKKTWLRRRPQPPPGDSRSAAFHHPRGGMGACCDCGCAAVTVTEAFARGRSSSVSNNNNNNNNSRRNNKNFIFILREPTNNLISHASASVVVRHVKSASRYGNTRTHAHTHYVSKEEQRKWAQQSAQQKIVQYACVYVIF